LTSASVQCAVFCLLMSVNILELTCLDPKESFFLPCILLFTVRNFMLVRLCLYYSTFSTCKTFFFHPIQCYVPLTMLYIVSLLPWNMQSTEKTSYTWEKAIEWSNSEKKSIANGQGHFPNVKTLVYSTYINYFFPCLLECTLSTYISNYILFLLIKYLHTT